jgi:hypothetical protein
MTSDIGNSLNGAAACGNGCISGGCHAPGDTLPERTSIYFLYVRMNQIMNMMRTINTRKFSMESFLLMNDNKNPAFNRKQGFMARSMSPIVSALTG